MKKMILALLLVVFVAAPAVAGSARDAIKALKRVEAMADVGVTMMDYKAAVAEAKLEVEIFLDEYGGVSMEEDLDMWFLCDSLRVAVQNFGSAADVFGMNETLSSDFLSLASRSIEDAMERARRRGLY